MKAPMLIGAAMWGAFAILQLTLPGHPFDLTWFVIDCALCAGFAVAATWVSS
ncbi:hypothetical protein [Phenylobacterium sp.]|uniref:hypothetical protein n=1 Tax=Phenylobacterium sp. TaxID=1871053 RepID=UPI002FCBFB43